MIIKTIKVFEDELVRKINNLEEGKAITLSLQDKKRIIASLQYQNAMHEILDVALELKEGY